MALVIQLTSNMDKILFHQIRTHSQLDLIEMLKINRFFSIITQNKKNSLSQEKHTQMLMSQIQGIKGQSKIASSSRSQFIAKILTAKQMGGQNTKLTFVTQKSLVHQQRQQNKKKQQHYSQKLTSQGKILITLEKYLVSNFCQQITGNLFLGGQCSFGSEQVTKTIKLPYFKAPYSLRIKVSVNFYDQWEQKSYFYVKTNDKLSAMKSYSWCTELILDECRKNQLNSCGKPDYPDLMGQLIDFTHNVTQNDSKKEINLVFGAETGKTDSCDASWGINWFEIWKF